ncbi:MAG: hypothetical protein PUP90_09225 [Nostoc sp. S4]|nr:hypothetical protein [Nostoc sp. S4]
MSQFFLNDQITLTLAITIVRWFGVEDYIQVQGLTCKLRSPILALPT